MDWDWVNVPNQWEQLGNKRYEQETTRKVRPSLCVVYN